jgi:hypothetical protein
MDWTSHFMPPDNGIRYRIKHIDRVVAILPDGPRCKAGQIDNDAAFIVKACNSYQDLMDACKAASEILEALPPCTGDVSVAAHKLNSALKKISST